MTTLIPKFDFKNGGTTPTGAVNRPIYNKLSDIVSVKDFGAIGDGTTNDSAAFNNAILYAALNGGGVVYAPADTYLLTSTIIVPSNVTLDLGNSIITGPGVGSSTDLFQSGNLVGGAIVTNIGSTPETNLCTKMSITNGTINNCGTALNLYDCVWQCEFTNLQIQNCTRAVYANRVFYARFVNIISRGSASGATTPAIYFEDANVTQIESVFITDRVLGFQIRGSFGTKFLNCSSESCGTGVYISDETGPLQFDTCYFEFNTVVCVDCNSPNGKFNISFDNCLFNASLLGIRGDIGNLAQGASIIINETNRFLNNTTDIIMTENQPFSNNFIKQQLPNITVDQLPTLPSTYTIGASTESDINMGCYSNNDSTIIARTRVHGSTIVTFDYEGSGGIPQTGAVPFCTESSSGSGSSIVAIFDTNIKYNQFSTNVVFNIQVVDFNSTYNIYGFVFGNVVKQSDSSGKTVVASNNGGNLRLSISNFVTTFYATGIIRFV